MKTVRKHFSEKELVDLTLAIVTINGWNRISIAHACPAACEVRQGRLKPVSRSASDPWRIAASA